MPPSPTALFPRERLPATMTYGTALVAVVDGDPQAWAVARDRLRLPDPRRPVDLLPLPDWIHVEEDPNTGSAHLRLRRRAALAAHGLRPLDRPNRP